MDEVGIVDGVGNLMNSLVADYSIQKPDDLKHLSQKDLKAVMLKHNLKKAPAGRLVDAWKVKVGVMDAPSEGNDDGDSTYMEHARRLLTQVYYRQNM